LEHSAQPSANLSLTEYAVLGLLTFGPASGYELDKLAERSIAYLWRPAKSKIYAVLPRLVEHGLATAQRVDQDRRPDKQIYTMTRAGRRAMERWLTDDATPIATARSPLLLKLFFGALADEARIATMLEAWKERAEIQLNALRQIEHHIDRDRDFFPYLTLLHGIEDAESTLRWATQALDLLTERAEARSA
jgi:DNA-binding PadR family transcriptional regulator